MSLKMKLVSAITAMILMLGVMLTGILAAQQQTLTMTGNVNFNIGDKSLYVKQVRIKQDNNSDPQVVSGFLPGYINGEFNMNIGEYSNSLGSFALYFDIINATDIQWEISEVALSEQLQGQNVSVSYSGVIGVNDLTDTDSDDYKNFDPATTDIDGTFVIIITVPNSSNIDLSGITITLAEYVEETIYERVDAEGNPDPNGTYLLFGWYPQTVKSADVTVGSTPESNGYYLGSDGAYYMKSTAKVTSDGNNYADFKDGTSITQGNEYYFKMERLKWRILTENYEGSGNALIVCDTIIDAIAYQPYYKNVGLDCYATDEDGTILIDMDATPGQGVDDNNQVYANNYKHSEIRKFLNSTFYDTAFTEKQKELIVTTEVDNGIDSASGAEECLCENTFDNIYLLSIADILNEEYGFKPAGSSVEEIVDSAKIFLTTDFSRAMGAITVVDASQATGAGIPEEFAEQLIGAGGAFLRTPTLDLFGDSQDCAFVIMYGISFLNNIYNTDSGVVPALQIQL